MSCRAEKYRPSGSVSGTDSVDVARVSIRRSGCSLVGLCNLLQLPLAGELLLDDLEGADGLAAGGDDGFLGADAAICLHAQVEVWEKRMGHLVAGEEDFLVAEEAVSDDVAEGVVFLLEVEDDTVGDAWSESAVS